VEVTVALINEDIDEVLSGSDAADMLNSNEIQESLMNSGIITEEFTAGKLRISMN